MKILRHFYKDNLYQNLNKSLKQPSMSWVDLQRALILKYLDHRTFSCGYFLLFMRETCVKTYLTTKGRNFRRPNYLIDRKTHKADNSLVQMDFCYTRTYFSATFLFKTIFFLRIRHFEFLWKFGFFNIRPYF